MNQTPMEKPHKDLMYSVDELDGIKVGQIVNVSKYRESLEADEEQPTDPCIVTGILPNWEGQEYGFKDAEGRLYACSRDELGSNAGR